MGQFTRSVGHEILWFTVTVISLFDNRSYDEINEAVSRCHHSLVPKVFVREILHLLLKVHLWWFPVNK